VGKKSYFRSGRSRSTRGRTDFIHLPIIVKYLACIDGKSWTWKLQNGLKKAVVTEQGKLGERNMRGERKSRKAKGLKNPSC